jgi:hypothetical protein
MGHLPCYFFMFCKDFIIYKAGNEWLFMRDKLALFPSISRRVKSGNWSGIISTIKIKGFLVDSRHWWWQHNPISIMILISTIKRFYVRKTLFCDDLI